MSDVHTTQIETWKLLNLETDGTWIGQNNEELHLKMWVKCGCSLHFFEDGQRFEQIRTLIQEARKRIGSDVTIVIHCSVKVPALENIMLIPHEKYVPFEDADYGPDSGEYSLGDPAEVHNPMHNWIPSDEELPYCKFFPKFPKVKWQFSEA